MKRYRRQALYNYDKKQWQVYYKNKNGEIKFDTKIKDYKQVRKEIAKNTVKRPDDLITKKQSLIAYPELHSRIQDQKALNKLLKKKKLTAQEKREARELSTRSGMKKQEVRKKTKGVKKEKPIQIYEKDIPAVYYSSTSSGFHIQQATFKNIKKQIRQTFKGLRPERLQVTLDGYTGEINYSDLKSQDKFENAVSGALSGYGKVDWKKGRSNLKLSLIKR